MKIQTGQIWKRGEYYYFLLSSIQYHDEYSSTFRVMRLGSGAEYEVKIDYIFHEFIQ